MMITHAKVAQEIIASNVYMTIATASLDGNPWISPVFFAYDEQYSLFWMSNKDSRHSNLIRNNPQISIVIFDSQAPQGTVDAVYIEAEAKELTDESEFDSAVKSYSARSTLTECIPRDISEVTGNASWRMYKAIPKVVSKLGGHEYINGQYADIRIEIESLALD